MIIKPLIGIAASATLVVGAAAFVVSVQTAAKAHLTNHDLDQVKSGLAEQATSDMNQAFVTSLTCLTPTCTEFVELADTDTAVSGRTVITLTQQDDGTYLLKATDPEDPSIYASAVWDAVRGSITDVDGTTAGKEFAVGDLS